MDGGCLCGQVRYSVTGEPAMIVVCHCTHCQKQTGTTFSLLVAVPRSALTVQGELKTYHDTGDTGQQVDRAFCPSCGSPIVSKLEAAPELSFVKAGTLDDTSNLAPTMQVFCDSAQSWVKLEGLQSFGRAPG